MPGIDIEPLKVIPHPLAEQCYELFADVFADIDQLAAQRHMLTAEEFAVVAADSRVEKLLAYNPAGELVGIGAVTNVLEAHPLVSPRFYARMFPEQYARGALWYVMFVGVRPRELHIFRAIVEQLYAFTTSNNGVAMMDFCTFNDDMRGLPQATESILKRWDPGTLRMKLDSQTTWGFRFDGGGHPAPGPVT